MDPLSTGSLEVAQGLFVDKDELRKKADGMEAGLSLLCSFAEDKEGDRTEDDRASNNTSRLCLVELFDGLVGNQLEIGLLGEFGNDAMVVRVKPIDRI